MKHVEYRLCMLSLLFSGPPEEARDIVVSFTLSNLSKEDVPPVGLRFTGKGALQISLSQARLETTSEDSFGSYSL